MGFESDNSVLNVLLDQVRLVFQFPLLHAKDCDILANEISQKTGEQLSGSTVKRLFGFMKSASSPNKYTLNVLSRYVGSNDFASFIQRMQPSDIISSVSKLSAETFQAVKSNSSIPAENWFLNQQGLDRLNAFSKSDKRITAVIGDGGSGKSVLSAQFYQHCIKNGNQILYLSAPKFNRMRGEKPIGSWIGAIEEPIDFFVLDGFEETAYNYVDLRIFFAELSEFVSCIKSNLKVIITIRPFSWIKLREAVYQSGNRDIWYDVSFEGNDPIKVSNMPPLDFAYIKSTLPETVNEGLFEFLKRPVFFQLYLKSDKKHITNDWELLHNFFATKVWSTAHAYEKNEFFKTILAVTDFGKLGNSINRREIEQLIVRYKKAHLDLLTFNILCEEKEVNKFGTLTSTYRFGYDFYFDFVILSSLLEKHKGYSQQLIEEINNNYPDERKLTLLKLALSFGLTEKNLAVSSFFEITLTEFERQSCMIHLANQIRVDTSLQEHILPEFVKNNTGRKYFIERWVDEEYLDGFYGETLKYYLNFVQDTQDLLFAHCLLYYAAWLKQTKSEMKIHIEKIKSITISSKKIHPYVLGRNYKCLLLHAHTFEENTSLLKKEIQEIIRLNIRESESDLPVHEFGFEFNILHAEFLTGKYHFTKYLIGKCPKKMNHKNDSDIVLHKIFHTAFLKQSKNIIDNSIFSEIDLNQIQPWYRATVRNYLVKLSTILISENK